MKLFKNIILGIMLISAAMASTAYARTAVPIEEHDNIAIAATPGKEISAEQVRQAIIAGGGRQSWTFADSGVGQLTGTLVVRGKHTIKVTIDYNPKSYSIHYSDSINMKYSTANGVPVIHPFYNNWVSSLINEINNELTKPR